MRTLTSAEICPKIGISFVYKFSLFFSVSFYFLYFLVDYFQAAVEMIRASGRSPELSFRELSRTEGFPPFYKLQSAYVNTIKLRGASTWVGSFQGLADWSREFSAIFCIPVTLTNFHVMSWDESLAFSSVILADRIVEFLARSLLDSSFPISLNSIWFLFEMWSLVKGEPPLAVSLRSLGNKFLRSEITWTRGQLIRYLTDNTVCPWFTPDSGARLLKAVVEDENLGNLLIPKTWEPLEHPGFIKLFFRKDLYLNI
mgnify:CR=1 FL=1